MAENSSDFNTMQGLFQTNSQQQGTYVPQNQQSQPSYVPQQNNHATSNNANVNDFSTMQNLFQTQAQGITLNTSSNETKQVPSNDGKIDPNSSDDIFQSMGINIPKSNQSP